VKNRKKERFQALLWKIAVLEVKNPPVGAGTFCPLSILIFYILLCWKYLPVSEAGPLRGVTGKFRKILKLKMLEKTAGDYRLGRESPGLRHFQQSQEQ
jgi:hypothetical protein